MPPISRYAADPELIGMLLYDEGVRLEPYDDATGQPIPRGERPTGHATIGVGHKLLRFESFDEGISGEKAIQMLVRDIEIAEAGYKRIFGPASHPRPVKNALVCMIFQMGETEIRSWHKMKEALSTRNYEMAAKHASESKWYRDQTPDRARRVVGKMTEGIGYDFTTAGGGDLPDLV